MTAKTNSDYSKAYYNQRKRNKVTLSVEKITTELAKFIFKHNEEDYYRLFRNNLEIFTSVENLDKETKEIRYVVLRNPLNVIKAYAVMGDLELTGKLSELYISPSDYKKLENYNIKGGQLKIGR